MSITKKAFLDLVLFADIAYLLYEQWEHQNMSITKKAFLDWVLFADIVHLLYVQYVFFENFYLFHSNIQSWQMHSLPTLDPYVFIIDVK